MISSRAKEPVKEQILLHARILKNMYGNVKKDLRPKIWPKTNLDESPSSIPPLGNQRVMIRGERKGISKQNGAVRRSLKFREIFIYPKQVGLCGGRKLTVTVVEQ